ncbi:hypothetical protein [Pyrococcus kukulkanii]
MAEESVYRALNIGLGYSSREFYPELNIDIIGYLSIAPSLKSPSSIDNNLSNLERILREISDTDF